MNKKICILSTKKLTSNQKQFLAEAGFLVIDTDFIKITLLPFHLKLLPSLLLFTSQNAVKSVLKNGRLVELKSIPAVCVGSQTRKLLENNGFKVLISKEYADELAPVIQTEFAQHRLAFFAGNIRRNTLPDAMRKNNIFFEEYTVYSNVENPVKIEPFANGILFFSPSGIHSYLKANSIANQKCFCIGHTTAEALKNITPNIVLAKHPLIEETLRACVEYYQSEVNQRLAY
jgi:uroporphyrinogen-III synthase